MRRRCSVGEPARRGPPAGCRGAEQQHVGGAGDRTSGVEQLPRSRRRRRRRAHLGAVNSSASDRVRRHAAGPRRCAARRRAHDPAQRRARRRRPTAGHGEHLRRARRDAPRQARRRRLAAFIASDGAAERGQPLGELFGAVPGAVVAQHRLDGGEQLARARRFDQVGVGAAGQARAGRRPRRRWPTGGSPACPSAGRP